MEYIITENKLGTIIYGLIDDVMSECDWYHEEFGSYNYTYDWYGYIDVSYEYHEVFRYLGHGGGYKLIVKKNSVILDNLTTLMGDKWEDIIVTWFKKNFPDKPFNEVVFR